VATGVLSALVRSSKTPLGWGSAGFLKSGTGGAVGPSSSSTWEAVLEGGVSSTWLSESASLGCRLVLPVSSLRTRASKVWSKSLVSIRATCCFLRSVAYCLVNRALTAVRRLSTQERWSKDWYTAYEEGIDQHAVQRHSAREAGILWLLPTTKIRPTSFAVAYLSVYLEEVYAEGEAEEEEAEEEAWRSSMKTWLIRLLITCGERGA
jgi:hypothetical protein